MPISMKFISTSLSGKLILLLLIDPRFIPSSLSSFPIRALKNRQRTRRDRIIELKVKTDKIKYIFIIEGKKKKKLTRNAIFSRDKLEFQPQSMHQST